MQNEPGTNELWGDGELSDDKLDDVSGGTIQADIDSMGDVSQIDSMRMQSFMVRKSKSQGAMSNLNRKVAQTSEIITQNIK